MPQLVLFGHAAAITALAWCTRERTGRTLSCIFSAAEDGCVVGRGGWGKKGGNPTARAAGPDPPGRVPAASALHAWSVDDGRCLVTAQTGLEAPSQLAPTRGGQFLVCCSRSPTVAIFDTFSLQVGCAGSRPHAARLTRGAMQLVHVLSSAVRPDWISALCACDLLTSAGVMTDGLITLAVDGTLAVWSLAFLQGDHPEGGDTSSDVPHGPIRVSRFGDSDTPAAVDVDLRNPGAILLVWRRTWRIVAAANFAVLHQVECPSQFGWAGGCFLNRELALIWSLVRRASAATATATQPSYDAPYEGRIWPSMGFASAPLTPCRAAPLHRAYNSPLCRCDGRPAERLRLRVPPSTAAHDGAGGLCIRRVDITELVVTRPRHTARNVGKAAPARAAGSCVRVRTRQSQRSSGRRYWCTGAERKSATTDRLRCIRRA